MTTDLFVMPPETPRLMPVQDFGAVYRDAAAPGARAEQGQTLWRALAFSPAMAATVGLLFIMFGWFGDQGISLPEGLLIALICFNFFWISFTVSTVALGFWSLTRRAPRATAPIRPMDVALLMPVYNEVPWYVLGNARSMLEELRSWGGEHRYAIFILSDTRDEGLAAQEQRMVEALRANLSPGLELYYRRRVMNTDRKVGNIADWVARWGGAYDAMLVLDADSLMTGRAILNLTDALASDPAAGLIQSFPQLIGAQSVFARMQQFANTVYGAAFAEGMARWCGQEGNYWGHNAIIR
ncbi:MAG: glucans biosynthesis glucosyltransferase MdoH, partial [Pseudooceanicola sp.]|nr:glucans biosynthesis glucosyltransferase MdoH [Pseudooceanicola sp.]